MRELRDGVEERNGEAGKAVQASVRFHTPIGTPESTAKPDYKVTAALWRSIDYRVQGDEGVVIGTNVKYAAYVHNGTYKQARGRGEWSEAEAREWNALRLTEYGDPPGPDNEGDGPDGMAPRAFLVNGLLDAKPVLSIIYHRPIDGGRV